MIRFMLCCCLVVTAAQSLLACSVPVFGYALRRWPADPHVLAVANTAAAERLNAHITDARTARGLAAVNLTIELDAALPEGQVELRMPHATGPWYRGALPDSTLADVINSPARRHLFERLTAGDSVVWVVMQSGNAQADRDVEQRLRLRLATLENYIELPALDNSGATDRTLSVPAAALRIRFSIITVAAGDQRERWFTQQITSLLGDPRARATAAGKVEPVVMPVYGQGRALYAFSASALTDAAIDDATLFLCGNCSCEIKNQNPGEDLLIAGDWFTAMEAQSDKKDQRAEIAQQAHAAMLGFPPRGFLVVLALLIIAIAAVVIMATPRHQRVSGAH